MPPALAASKKKLTGNGRNRCMSTHNSSDSKAHGCDELDDGTREPLAISKQRDKRQRHYATCIIVGVGALILLLAFLSRNFASDPDVLYAPELTGDGQTA